MEAAKKKKRRIVLVCVLIAGFCLVGAGIFYVSAQPSSASVETITLEPTSLKKTVSANGTVESTVVENVSNSSGDPVWEILTPVGTNVSRGDVLATLYNKDTDLWTNVTATVDGTVTNVATQNGTPASGVLFTIQNSGSLRVRAKIKQNDLSSIGTGMNTSIEADGTNGAVYSGTVLSVAPTAAGSVTSQTGTTRTDSSSTPEYEMLVSITSPVDGLKIGMKTKLSVDSETKDNVFAVPIDTITTGTDGQKAVMAADEKDGVYTVREIPITVGMVTDSMAEISSPDLSAGINIVKDPSSVSAGQTVTLQVQS